MKFEAEGKRFFVITLLIIVISFLHYFTGTHLGHLHAIYARAYYIPIILAAFWYGSKGGILTSVVVSLAYLPHVIFQWGEGLEDLSRLLGNLSRFLEIVMFNVVGFLVGYMVQRVREQRNRYQQAARELEQSYEKLTEQTERLLEMEDQLRTSDRLAVLGELTASLAHEVRNPLGSIRGTVDILRREYKPGSKQLEFFQILIKEVNRLNGVVENYLGMAKPKHQRMGDQNVVDIIQTVVDLVSTKARKEKIEVIVVKPAKAITVFTDENLLRQVLLNVILNAMASIENGGRVVVSPSLKEGGKAEGVLRQEFASIRVSDTGKGIPASEIETVFKPFYTTKAEGTGLGMAIAKRAVQQLKGEIKLESKEDVGTTVIITVPCAQGKQRNRWGTF